jgi:uridine kinase
MKRQTLITKISHHIAKIEKPHPVRVAIDGVDCAGKTILAAELKKDLETANRSIIHASIDGFHRPQKARYGRGRLSPEGYYYDSFDLDAIKEYLLEPLGPDGNLHYVETVFDFRTDSPIPKVTQRACRDAVLLFDGVFLMRPELNTHWDFRIFVYISFETSLQRALTRDVELFGSAKETRKRYLSRYIPGQKLYHKTVDPESKVDIIIDNNNPANPCIVRGTGT